MTKKVLSIILAVLMLTSCIGCGTKNEPKSTSSVASVTESTAVIETTDDMLNDMQKLEQCIKEVNEKIENDVTAYQEKIMNSEELTTDDISEIEFSFEINGKKFFDQSAYDNITDDLQNDLISAFDDIESVEDIDVDAIKEPLIEIMKTAYSGFATVGDLCAEYNIEHDESFYTRTIDSKTYSMVYGVKKTDIDTYDDADETEPKLWLVEDGDATVCGIKLSDDLPLCLVSSYEGASVSNDWELIDDIYTCDEFLDFTVSFVIDIMSSFMTMSEGFETSTD